MDERTLVNDPELLDLFLSDMEGQSSLWKPTAYWSTHCRRIERELEKVGLSAFRRNWGLMQGVDLGFKHIGLERPDYVFNGFAKALWGLSPFRAKIEEFRRLVNNHFKNFDVILDQHIAREVALFFRLLTHGSQARPMLMQVEDSGVGEPFSYTIDGRKYTSNLLHHACLYSIALQNIVPHECRRVIEIGGGYGALPEIMFKFHRDQMEYFVEVDIPPLVYVATQYLKTVFPGKVLDYRDIRGATAITASDIKGKILVIPPWSVPMLNLDFDLLWNSISFQEMEFDVVNNYLNYLAKTSSNVFINTRTHGHREGLGGQARPISFDWLSDQLIARGFMPRDCDRTTAEWSAFRAVLPQHSVGLFVAAHDRIAI